MVEDLERAVIDSLPAQLAVLDPDGVVVSVNSAWRASTAHVGRVGCDVGSSYLDACEAVQDCGDEEDTALVIAGVRQVLAGDLPVFATDVQCDTPEGPRWYTLQAVRMTGPRTGAVVSYTDVTTRKRAEQTAHHLATHDVLTGLPNRVLICDRLEQALGVAQRTGGGVGVLFLDIDRFKDVNDTYGHAAGDAVLVEVGRRLSGCVRPGDTVGRLSGDEFVVVCAPGGGDPLDAQTVAWRVQQAMDEPVRVAGVALEVQVSIGVHVADRWTAGPQEVLDVADAAMFEAKARRRAARSAGATSGTAGASAAVAASSAARATATSGEDYSESVRRLLHLLRLTLSMDIAWVSEFEGSDQVLKFVDVVDGAPAPPEESRSPLSGAYCARVLDGSMPSAIPDTHLDPVAVLLPVTVDLHIGSYVGVPLRGADGTPTGMLCAAAGSARPELGADDVTSARLIADVVEDLRRRDHGAAASRRRRKRLQETVLDLCRGKGRRLEFQPIVHLPTGTEVAAEALTRFDDPARNPAQWFATATALGLGRELEVAVATSALKEVRGVLAVSINMSPQVIVDGGLDELLAGRDPHGVIVEVTEHAPVASYAALEQALAPHRERGLRVAVDDVGAGYASLAHVLEMHPDILKIDMSLVRDVDSDVVRQSLVASIGAFGAELGATVVAEGVETEAERDVLVRLGVDHAQGFLFHP